MWKYFNKFFEGKHVAVAMPLNRSGNQRFTAAEGIELPRGNIKDNYGSDQVDPRVCHLHSKHAVLEEEREDAPACGHCGARGYLGGLSSVHAPLAACALPTPKRKK